MLGSLAARLGAPLKDKPILLHMRHQRLPWLNLQSPPRISAGADTVAAIKQIEKNLDRSRDAS